MNNQIIQYRKGTLKQDKDKLGLYCNYFFETRSFENYWNDLLHITANSEIYRKILPPTHKMQFPVSEIAK